MSTPVSSHPALREDIARFIRGEGGQFDDLALRLFRWQIRQNADYRAIVGGAFQRVHGVAEVPAVPVALWRDLDLVSFDVAQARLVFRTSGTTGRRGEVHRLDTDLYDLGARRFAEHVVGPLPARGVSLVPDALDSSLGHMCRTFSPELSQRFSGVSGVDVVGARADLAHWSRAGVPVFVPGTALALAALVAAMAVPIPLATGSVVMVTGGFKGRVAAISATELRRELVRLFPGSKVVEEYGMTELSSQMWADGPGEPLRVPPWMRVQVVDPWTGAPARRGLLRFIDLANIDTVLAIETRDEGTMLDDGRLILHGRLPGAPARGCSLTVEEAMSSVSTSSKRRTSMPMAQSIPRVEGTVDPADLLRARRVVHALGRLPTAEPAWGQGLPLASVIRELSASVNALTEAALVAELCTVPASARPHRVAIWAAEGVFTAALEWVVLCLAAGMSVRWKAPAAWPHFARAVGSVLAAEGLPVTVTTDRSPGAVDVLVVFGSDATIDALRGEEPSVRVVGYGHRFGLGIVEGTPDPATVAAVVSDHVRYDTRGCMAPAGLVIVDGAVPAWLDALAAALSRHGRDAARGVIAPAHGPEWRRRRDLGRATLGVREVGDAAVVAVAPEHWVPSALPWMVSLVPVSRAALPHLLDRYAHQLSVVARPDSLSEVIDARVDRTCRPGAMQSPPFPRLHDGAPMLARICAWNG